MKTAWVLCGGGSRGAYEIGVWQALRQAGLKPDIVTGTSIGALNGALIVQDDFESALDLWQNVEISDVMKDGFELEISAIMENKEKIGPFLKKYINDKGADNTPLKEMISQRVNEEKLRNSDIDFGLVTVRYPSLQAVEISKAEIPEGKIKDYLIATSACFPAFPIHEFDGQQYIDGGYQDNMPIALALKMGADQVLAINLHYNSPIHPVLEKLPQVQVISPSRDLGSFLSFDPVMLEKNRKLGFMDANKFLGMYCGQRYTFDALNDSMKQLAQTMMKELSLFQCALDDSDHPFIDTVWPQSALLAQVLTKDGMSCEDCLIHLSELCADLLKKDRETVIHLPALLEEIFHLFHDEDPQIEKERSLYDRLIHQPTAQALLALIADFNRLTLCRTLYDQMKSRPVPQLLDQLHWLSPLMEQEILISWFAIFLSRHIDQFIPTEKA